MSSKLSADSVYMIFPHKDDAYANLDLEALERVSCSDCGGDCATLYDIGGEILCKLCIKERLEEREY